MLNIKISTHVWTKPGYILSTFTNNWSSNLQFQHESMLENLQMILNIKNLNILESCNKLKKCNDEEIINWVLQFYHFQKYLLCREHEIFIMWWLSFRNYLTKFC